MAIPPFLRCRERPESPILYICLWRKSGARLIGINDVGGGDEERAVVLLSSGLILKLDPRKNL
jgi:hypothetical protein